MKRLVLFLLLLPALLIVGIRMNGSSNGGFKMEWNEPSWKTTNRAFLTRSVRLTSESEVLWCIKKSGGASEAFAWWLPPTGKTTVVIDQLEFEQLSPGMSRTVSVWRNIRGADGSVALYLYPLSAEEMKERREFRAKYPWLRWVRPIPRVRQVALPY